MSDRLPCCPHSVAVEIIKKCRKPHCKAKISLKIVEQIDSAKHLICVAMYLFTWKNIADALLRARKREVIVRVVLNKTKSKLAQRQIYRMRVTGIYVKITKDVGKNLMHNTCYVIDVLRDEKSLLVNRHPLNGVLINGSMNWSMSGLNLNWENIQFTSDDHLKTQYKMTFDYIWDRIE